MNSARRQWLLGISSISAAAILTGCRRAEEGARQEEQDSSEPGEVTATEDLMREHGILRRVLLVYQETSSSLGQKTRVIPSAPLQKAAKLFRGFGEEYHEKKLEETYIFPALKQRGGAGETYVDVLATQHQRGRELTNYILEVTGRGDVTDSNIEPLKKVLESFVRMYEHHAAIEDTVVFPAWKQTFSDKQLAEIGEKFEDIEHQQFGEDGFDDAVKQIADIERELGLDDLSQFTASSPTALK